MSSALLPLLYTECPDPKCRGALKVSSWGGGWDQVCQRCCKTVAEWHNKRPYWRPKPLYPPKADPVPRPRPSSDVTTWPVQACPHCGSKVLRLEGDTQESWDLKCELCTHLLAVWTANPELLRRFGLVAPGWHPWTAADSQPFEAMPDPDDARYGARLPGAKAA